MSKPSLETLQAEIEALRDQLAALGSRAAHDESTVTPPAPSQGAFQGEISEETVLAISAAVAAYLGKRPRIRAIRLIGSTAWAQQGRVSIQASHRLNVQHHHYR